MKDKENLEKNIINSFRMAKNDIIKIQNAINLLSHNQEKIMEWLNDTREKETHLYHKLKQLEQKAGKPVKPIIKKFTTTRVRKVITHLHRHKKKFIASKKGKIVHESNCPFAKNIKPKSRVTFKSKAKAFNLGYKACDCIKRI